jgi:hypothetical protein
MNEVFNEQSILIHKPGELGLLLMAMHLSGFKKIFEINIFIEI